jgi:molecular chaperone GrpE
VTIKEAELSRLKEEAEKAKENWDKYVRLNADMENTRKRWERERGELIRFGNEGLLVDLLNINDELERALSLSQEKHEDFTAFMKGVEMIVAHLHDLLKRNGIKPMEAHGKKFDPNFHEALMQVEQGDLPENTIVEELQKGYMLDNHVFRTAKVKVSHKPPEAKKQDCA